MPLPKLPAEPRPGSAVQPRWESRLEAAIIERIESDRYDLWFRPHTKFSCAGEALIVGVPNLFTQEWLEKTFGDAVRDAAVVALGPDATVRFVIDPELFQRARNAERVPRETPRPEARRERPGEARATRKWRTLEHFVVGACNRVAFASAQSVVEEPGQHANPLVLYGPVGTGKTHLLEGVYAGLRRSALEGRVTFLTAEEFVNRFVSAMHLNRQGAFRKQLRESAVLLVDDLDFLAGKKATQVEFLHTFDALLADNRQIVLTTDCHPRLSEDLMPELVDRLIGGAVWSLLPPDAETRLAILRAKSGHGAPPIPEPVLRFLAEQLRGNVRELEGAVHSLRHFSRATARPIDLELAREALGELLRHAVRVVSIADVEAAVCTTLRLAANALRSRSRAWAISHPRMLAIFLCRKHTAASYGEISIYFGNKTHSTAVAAEKAVRQWLQGNESVKAGDRQWKARELVEHIERELGR